MNSSRPGQRGPGTGCAAVPQPALKPPRAQPALKLPRAQPALKVRACARTSLSRARTCPCGRRGHTKTEPTERDRLEELLACRETLPPPGVDEASWLKQIALKKTWQNETIKAMQARCSTLELELAVALAENSAKDAEIVQLRQQALPRPPTRPSLLSRRTPALTPCDSIFVHPWWQFVKLQDEYMAVSEHIVSYIKSTPALLQASHATKLQENPGFSLVLGLGYNEAQVHPRSCTSAPPQPEDRHPPPPPPSSFASHGTTFNGMFLETSQVI